MSSQFAKWSTVSWKTRSKQGFEAGRNSECLIFQATMHVKLNRGYKNLCGYQDVPCKPHQVRRQNIVTDNGNTKLSSRLVTTIQLIFPTKCPPTQPLAWLIAPAPRRYSIATYNNHFKIKQSPELRNPRSFVAQVAAESSPPPPTRDRIISAESAQLNGSENLGFFAAAIAVGNTAELDVSLLNGLAWGYGASGVLYNIIFTNNDTDNYVFVRTAVYMIGTGINCALFAMAGNNWLNK